MKCKVQSLKFLSLSFAFCVLSFTFTCYAKEITIIYTGETHAMLYPCNCPVEADGGISRRATLIKKLRKENPHTLLLDSGGFFSGGLMDEYTQNTELDKERTLINLKAMELMKYDALAIGDDEFNFGKEFLEETIDKTNLVFLSCNIESDKLLSYIIKEIEGTKIGIIGLTSPQAIQKVGGLKFIEPKLAVKKALEELKKEGIDFVILLSHLGEQDDLRLIKEIEGIDILIIAHSRAKEELYSKVGSTLILRPSWQGRRLNVLSLTLKDNKITDYKVYDLRLSHMITDALEILSILPECFSDANCRKDGFIGKCHKGGNLDSRCSFSLPARVNLLVIVPLLCKVCTTEKVVNYLHAQFTGLVVSYLNYPSKKANKLIKDLDIKSLPVYLLGKEIEKEKGFDSLKENLEPRGDFYMLKPEFSGIAYFLDRKKIKGKLDLFISLYDKDTPELLESTGDFGQDIHFLVVEKDNRFDALKGNLEVEEYLRAICVKKYYPEIFWNYITCRAKIIDSSWWDDCLDKLDTDKIKNCARSQEGHNLLKENISLNKELQIMTGPVYLLDNQQIFSFKGTKKEDLKKILAR